VIRFAQPSEQRELILAGVFLLIVLNVGALGYMVIESWSWADSFYMAFITISTIGFREVHEMGASARMFTIFIGLLGIGSVAFIATRAAQIVLAHTALRIKQMNKQIGRIHNHYILAGYGRIGRRIANDLMRSSISFVVIEFNDERAEQLDQMNMLYVHGNAEHEDILERAGIDRAKGLILTLPDDRANVFATLVAREINPDLVILVRADSRANLRKLMRAGADKVISPYEIGADRMAQVILKPNVDHFLEHILRTESIHYMMEEVTVRDGSLLAGSSLVKANFRQRFEAIVVGIVDAQTGELTFNPSPDMTLNAGDTLLVMGDHAVIDTLKKEGCEA